jgi:hypothetical protein
MWVSCAGHVGTMWALGLMLAVVFGAGVMCVLGMWA